MNRGMMDRIYLEYSMITQERTERELSLQARNGELMKRLETAQAAIHTSDTEKLKALRDELARIVETGKRANRGQILSWIKKARAGSA